MGLPAAASPKIAGACFAPAVSCACVPAPRVIVTKNGSGINNTRRIEIRNGARFFSNLAIGMNKVLGE
jgi:hypothetical protein